MSPWEAGLELELWVEVCPPRPQDGRVGRMSLVLSIIAECVAGGNVVVYESERVELMLLATI